MYEKQLMSVPWEMIENQVRRTSVFYKYNITLTKNIVRLLRVYTAFYRTANFVVITITVQDAQQHDQ